MCFYQKRFDVITFWDPCNKIHHKYQVTYCEKEQHKKIEKYLQELYRTITYRKTNVLPYIPVAVQ